MRFTIAFALLNRGNAVGHIDIHGRTEWHAGNQTPAADGQHRPDGEVELCGPATLASGFVLFEKLGLDSEAVLKRNLRSSTRPSVDSDTPGPTRSGPLSTSSFRPWVG